MNYCELDRQIAEQIFGLKVSPVAKRGYAKDGNEVPRYSTDIAEAMKVLDRMRDFWSCRWLIIISREGFHLRRVICVTRHIDVDEKTYRCDKPLGTSETLDGLAKVICEAALSEMAEIEAGKLP